MKPKIVRMKKRKQGSNDPASPWCVARFEWATQLLVRLGKIKPTSLPQPLEKRHHRASIDALEMEQIVWWDETHIKQEGGMVTSDGYQVRFR